MAIFNKEKDKGKNDSETVVVKLGGEVLGPQYIKKIQKQIIKIHAADYNVVVVHGGGNVVNEVLQEIGIRPQYANGERIDTQKNDPVVVSTLIQVGRRLHLDLGEKFVISKNHFRQNPSECHRFDLSLIREILNFRQIPIVGPAARFKNGEYFNMNADEVAADIATLLNAKYLIYAGKSWNIDILGESIAVINNRVKANIERAGELLELVGWLPKIKYGMQYASVASSTRDDNFRHANVCNWSQIANTVFNKEPRSVGTNICNIDMHHPFMKNNSENANKIFKILGKL